MGGGARALLENTCAHRCEYHKPGKNHRQKNKNKKRFLDICIYIVISSVGALGGRRRGWGRQTLEAHQ